MIYYLSTPINKFVYGHVNAEFVYRNTYYLHVALDVRPLRVYTVDAGVSLTDYAFL